MTAQYHHSLSFESERCDGCMSCMRVCPTAAVRVRSGRATNLEDRCIDCGECIRVCPNLAILPLTGHLADLSKYDSTVAIPSPVLYAQFDDGTLPGIVIAALKKCGFTDVECVSSAFDAATVAIELFLNGYRGAYPLIASFCPTIVRLVQVEYPGLVGQLMPILAPREIAARQAKGRRAAQTGLPSDRIGAIYITPCPSKVVAMLEHPGLQRSYLDGAVAISDLFPQLRAAVAGIGKLPGKLDGGETASGVGWAFLGGLPRFLPAENTLAVAGLHNVIRILDDVEKGKLQEYAFIECHACPEGCVAGPLTVEDPYVARAKTIKLMQKLPAGPNVDRNEIERQYREGMFLMDEPLTSRPLLPLDPDISKAILKMKKRDRILAGLPRIDCGACGAPTCYAFSEDVVLGEAQLKDCVLFSRRSN